MKKKIVQIVRAPVGGIRKHILTIVEGLGSEQFEMFLITNEGHGDKGYQHFLEENPQFSKNVFNLNIIDKPSFFDVVNLIKIYQFIKVRDVDIIHGHGAKGGLYARIVGFVLGKTTIYTAHGGSLHRMHGKIKNIVYGLVEKFLYHLTSKLVFESKYSMIEYERRVHANSNKFHLNYNAIELPKNFEKLDLKPIDRTKTITIGAFGLLRKIKGHDLLIKAAKILISKGISLEVRIFGEGEERNNLESLAKDLGISKEVNIYNYTDNIFLEMKSCDIIVHPSHFESFGYVPLEAFVNGVSVVSSLKGGLSEVMQGGELGFCVKNLDIENLSMAIEECIENEALRVEKFKKAKKIISEKFSQEGFLKGIKDIYICSQ